MSYNSGVIVHVIIISNRSHNYSLNCTPLSPTVQYYYDKFSQSNITNNILLNLNILLAEMK